MLQVNIMWKNLWILDSLDSYKRVNLVVVTYVVDENISSGAILDV